MRTLFVSGYAAALMLLAGVSDTAATRTVPVPPEDCSARLTTAELDAIAFNWAHAIDTGIYSPAWVSCLDSLSDGNMALMGSRLDAWGWSAPTGRLDPPPPEILQFESGQS